MAKVSTDAYILWCNGYFLRALNSNLVTYNYTFHITITWRHTDENICTKGLTNTSLLLISWEKQKFEATEGALNPKNPMNQIDSKLEKYSTET